jgi:polyferredoxin
MLRRHRSGQKSRGVPWAILAASDWIAAGLLLGIGKPGRRARLAFAVISVIAGLSLGWMVGQDQLIGWARNGIGFSQGVPLVFLTAVALLVPAITGKNVYCSRICPHGAAQTLAGMAVKRRFSLPARWHRQFQRIPWLTLAVIWALALSGSGFPLAMIEPFEVWSAGFYAVLPAAIPAAGLLPLWLPNGCHA